MGKQYNPIEELSYLMYFDLNNMYGMSRSEALSLVISNKLIVFFVNFSEIRNDDEFRYIFEVDLNYPKKLYESYKDLPLCFVHMIPPTSRFKYKNL